MKKMKENTLVSLVKKAHKKTKTRERFFIEELKEKLYQEDIYCTELFSLSEYAFILTIRNNLYLPFFVYHVLMVGTSTKYIIATYLPAESVSPLHGIWGEVSARREKMNWELLMYYFVKHYNEGVGDDYYTVLRYFDIFNMRYIKNKIITSAKKLFSIPVASCPFVVSRAPLSFSPLYNPRRWNTASVYSYHTLQKFV